MRASCFVAPAEFQVGDGQRDDGSSSAHLRHVAHSELAKGDLYAYAEDQRQYCTYFIQHVWLPLRNPCATLRIPR